MDDADAAVFAVANLLEMANSAIIDDLATVAAKRVDAGKHVHQRGFSRAVFADQCVDFTAAHLQADIVQRLDTGEFFCNMSHFENVIRHGVPPRSRVSVLQSNDLFKKDGMDDKRKNRDVS
ncbi:hypothetical protein SDC9_117482 [bioreactor metagenome]|uniref:Uncharacterized protein n=1 Tax=bioreactor metagenome TaxID=1076179 RepID=A0A645BZM0_9ZZZZ